jgi:DNA-binding MarR family transcriptional regulator
MFPSHPRSVVATTREVPSVSDTETAVEIEPCTLFSFLQAARVMTDTLDGALSETSLSAATLEALTELADAREPLAPRELARRLSCSFAEMAELLDDLDVQGLIERRDAGVGLTLLGQERQRTAAERVRAAQQQIADAMATVDASALERTLAAMRAAATRA